MGEVVLRIDPGENHIYTTQEFEIWEADKAIARGTGINDLNSFFTYWKNNHAYGHELSGRKPKVLDLPALFIGFLDLHNAVGSPVVQVLDDAAWPANLNTFDRTLCVQSKVHPLVAR